MKFISFKIASLEQPPAIFARPMASGKVLSCKHFMRFLQFAQVVGGISVLAGCLQRWHTKPRSLRDFRHRLICEAHFSFWLTPSLLLLFVCFMEPLICQKNGLNGKKIRWSFHWDRPSLWNAFLGGVSKGRTTVRDRFKGAQKETSHLEFLNFQTMCVCVCVCRS